ncbi:MAG: diguanylate cyclase [Venatoribacter sp.]
MDVSLHQRKFLFFFILAFCTGLWITNVEAASNNYHAFVHSSAAPISLAQAMNLPQSSWEEKDASHINYGFSQQHYWIKFPLEQLNFSYAKQSWIFEIAYPLLNHIDFYITDADDNQLVHIKTGNKYIFHKRLMAIPNFTFPIPALSEAKNVYIHTHSASALQVPIHVYTEKDYWLYRINYVTFAAVFQAIMLCMLIYNLLTWSLSKEHLLLIYSLTIASFALMMANLHGWSFMYLWPNSPAFNERITLISLASTSMLVAFFGIYLLNIKERIPKAYTVLIICTALCFIFGLSSFILPYHVVVQLIAAMAVILGGFAITFGWVTWVRTRERDILLFFFANTSLIVSLIFYALQKFGILPFNIFTEHAPEVGSIAMVLLLALSIAERQNRLKMAHIHAQEEMLRLQLEANLMLDQKVRERTLDLEKANRNLQEESTTDALTGVRNRRYFDQRFFALYQDAYREKKPISLLVMDIDHFKSFNDRYGHSVGDIVLQEVAKTMQRMVNRPLDSVYRCGGEEFAVILPDTDNKGAVIVAENIRQAIENLVISHDNMRLRITISIGVSSIVPVERHGEQLLYEQADDALYEAKKRGRNCVCIANLDAKYWSITSSE